MDNGWEILDEEEEEAYQRRNNRLYWIITRIIIPLWFICLIIGLYTSL